MTTTHPPAPARDRYAVPLLVAVLGGCLVALVLGLYARLHHPSGFALDVVGFSSALYAKAWLTTFAVAFAVVQVVTGRQAGRPGHAAWIATLHRSSGRIAILLTVPVVVHCIYALGFQTYSTRVLVHSVLGCFFYGAFAAKMLSLTWRDTMPRWAIPALGGTVFLGLIGVWATSSLWLFTSMGWHF
jgi:hypothetical protein